MIQGQHEDARMCLSVALTAARYNASVANYVEVLELTKGRPHASTTADSVEEVVTGARVRDRITGKEFVINARSVINATGPFTDTIRQMDDPQRPSICQPSAGVHIVLPGYYW